jgi:molybdopterin/thiamine biosynthesis adenylyltransferase
VKTRLHVPDPLWQAIRDDLLSTPSLERAGVGFAGLSNHGSDRRLLLRDWTPVPADEYLVQLGYHLEVSPTFWARHTKRARQSGEALVILHSHPTDERTPVFSPSDDGGEARLIPKIHARAEVPVAATVVSPGGHQARVTYPGRSPSPLEVRIAGATATTRATRADDRFDRQVRVLGRAGQAILSSLTVGVVGAGGLGSHVIQQLIHLGVGRLVVIDPDRVAASNLSRLVGASRWDALLRRPKTAIATRLARRVGGPTTVIPVDGSVTDEDPARRLFECDMVVGCTDNQWSRTVLNTIAYQFYIPVLDLGVELQALGSMGGRVTWLTPGSPCLWCCNVLNPARVRAEQLPAATLHDEVVRGYVEGLNEPAPAVVTINGVIASLAATELLARTTSFAGSEPRPTMLMYRLTDGVVRRTSVTPNPECPTCSPHGQLGLGDLGTAPWTSAQR